MSQTPDLTDEQRANLATLADYLAALPADYEQFDMSSFQEYSDGTSVFLRETEGPPICGTVACAAGHGIAAGVPATTADGNSWHAYSVRAFCPVGEAWNWCFDGDWDGVDNTPAGAAARIRVMLENGVPDNAYRQIRGFEPLSYVAVSA